MVKKKKDKLLTSLEKRLPSKRIHKKTKQVTLVIKQGQPHSILGEANKFFKDEVEEAEMALFFR